jgi:hypothetical protein
MKRTVSPDGAPTPPTKALCRASDSPVTPESDEAVRFSAMARIAGASMLPPAFLLKHSPHALSKALDWMYGVCDDATLNDATFMLGSRLLLRYLSKRVVHRARLQLTTAVCLVLAAKVHEVFPVTLSKAACEYTANAYTLAEALLHEVEVLRELGWAVTPPTPLDFLARFRPMESEGVWLTATYVCVVSAFVIDTHAVPAEQVAAACYWAAVRHHHCPWTPAMEALAGADTVAELGQRLLAKATGPDAPATPLDVYRSRGGHVLGSTPAEATQASPYIGDGTDGAKASGCPEDQCVTRR